MSEAWLTNIPLLLQSALKGRWHVNLPLSRYTSWRVGGLADYGYFPSDPQDLAVLLQHIPDTIPVTWLGLGSNTLVRDGGIRGLVIITQGCLKALEQQDSHVVMAQAGVAAAQLARYSAKLGLTGLEFLAGVPGTVGGALCMNAGCFGGETWQMVECVDMLNRQGQLIQRSASEFDVHYRQVEHAPSEWFIAGYFKLALGDPAESLRYIKTLLEKRAATQPTGVPTCGSVFKNPPNDYAGRLIEHSGLKGYGIGKAKISEKHGNFIMNEGGASACDIEALITHVMETVEAQFGICLQPEVHIIGEA
jgi:UDP-N-acetylmuramate dehydrogenase